MDSCQQTSTNTKEGKVSYNFENCLSLEFLFKEGEINVKIWEKMLDQVKEENLHIASYVRIF